MRRWREHMRVTTSKSKNSESFYITKGFINEKGVSTSSVVRKLGTLNDLLKDHGPTRDDVMAWAREQARLETEKYKKENVAKKWTQRYRNWDQVLSQLTVLCGERLTQYL